MTGGSALIGAILSLACQFAAFLANEAQLATDEHR